MNKVFLWMRRLGLLPKFGKIDPRTGVYEGDQAFHADLTPKDKKKPAKADELKKE